MLANIPMRQKILVMAAAMSGLLLAALDQTIVSTALPRIVSDLHGLRDLSWVVTAYLLTSTVSVPISGKLSDIFGRKKLFLIAILVFVAGSALSGISQNMAELIGFRAFQGIGAGMLFSMTFAVIGDLFSPAERARWQGIIAGVFGLASVIGPLLGGYLTDHASWRWNFYINVPVGIVAFLMISRFMPHIAVDRKDQKIDFLGAGLLTAGLSTLLLGLVWGGNQYAWGSAEVISMLVLAPLLLATFAWVEHAHAKDPILPLSLFRNSIFRVSMIIMFLVGLAMFGAILYIPLFAQDVLGRTATNSGVILIPMVFTLMIVSLSAGQYISRRGRYKKISVLGTAIVSAGILWLSTLSVDSSSLDVIERMVVIGAGLGISLPIFNLVVQNAFEHAKLGVATGSALLSRSIGSTVGVALMGTILNNQLNHRLASSGQVLTANQLSSLSSKNITPAVKTALAGSITEVFLIGGLVVSIAFFASLFLKEIPLRTSHDQPVNA
jgi:EmrB/QacA subfamily drug resistance transporter